MFTDPNTTTAVLTSSDIQAGKGANAVTATAFTRGGQLERETRGLV